MPLLGILYLTLPEHCRGGTDFFRHKRTGLEWVPTDIGQMLAAGYADPNQLIEEVVNADKLKPSKWEKQLTMPMRFNRLILFSRGCFTIQPAALVPYPKKVGWFI